MPVEVSVRGVPTWIDPSQLLGDGPWALIDGAWVARIERPKAADVQARLRGIGLGGLPIEVSVRPSLKRALVRTARTVDARRRRQTTPGFTRSGCRLDAEGKMSLTAESLALALGHRAKGCTVVDACGGAGGNAIGFARAGCRVTLIEPHGARLSDARHNAGVYGVADQIRFVHGSAIDHVPVLSADVLFVDPPWGEHWDRRHCDVTALPLLAPLLEASHGFANIWLKVPPSFDVSALPDFQPEACFGQAAGDNRRVKYLLLRRERAPSRLQ